MSEYVFLPERMAFVLHFSIVIACLKEPKTILLKRQNLIFSIVAGCVLFYLLLRILTRKKDRQIKLPRLQKVRDGHLGRWYNKSTLYKRFLN